MINKSLLCSQVGLAVHSIKTPDIPRKFSGFGDVFRNQIFQTSHHGSVETNLTSIHEDTVSIPGLAQWVRDPGLS